MKLVYTILLFLTSAVTIAQTETRFLHRAQQAVTDVIVHDVFSPPVASRIYSYPHIVAYEILVQEQSNYSSLQKSIKTFPKIPFNKSGKISHTVAAVYGFLYTAKNFVFSEKMFSDSMQAILNDLRILVSDKKIYSRSVEYGKTVGDAIIKWASVDQYAVTRSVRRYSHSRVQGKWLPTPPAYIAAVEPYWSRLRPFIIDSASIYKPPPPCEYDRDTSKKFYRQALQVYYTVKNLTPEQRDIALFWDCNPFFVNVTGHLMYATKKLSPGGHWLSIAGIVANQSGADMMTTSATYLYTALALYDGFLSCWDEKYRSNYIRPETFINSSIDENWRPLLQTPPFPEYTSGHSVISTAAARVLTAMYGQNFRFDDHTETSFGLPVRKFNSFDEAASEAAVSRLYGGIHFPEAIENGQAQGKKIGDLVVTKLSIMPVRQ
jgi:hypothetical protein